MKYEEIRNIAKDGDIIFLTVDKKNILSRITSWFTKSPYTHAAFLFWYKNRLMVSESTTHGGLRIVQASMYSTRNIDIISAPRSWEQIENSALEKIGTTKYGWFSAIYIGLREFMFTHFDVKLPSTTKNRNKACSEYVAEILEMPETDISPKNLYKKLTVQD